MNVLATLNRTTVRFFTKKVSIEEKLDKDFERVLRTYRWVMNSTFYPRYGLSGGSVTRSSRGQQVSALVAIVAVVLLDIWFYWTVNVQYLAPDETGYNASMQFWLITSYVIFVLCFLVNLKSVFDSGCHVDLILNIHEAFKLVKYDMHPYKNNLSIIGVIVIVSSLVSYLLYDLLKESEFWYTIIEDIICTVLDFNVLSAMSFVSLIRCNYVNWRSSLAKVFTQERGERQVELTEHSKAFSRMLYSYYLFIRVYKDLILMYFFHTFSHSLIFVQLGIIFFQENDFTNISTNSYPLILSFVWLVKSLYLLCALSAEVERCYRAVEDARVFVIQLVASDNCTVWERRILKNLVRLLRVRWCSWQVRGAFAVDGAMPFRVTQLISTYVVVLLQFVFQRRNSA